MLIDPRVNDLVLNPNQSLGLPPPGLTDICIYWPVAPSTLRSNDLGSIHPWTHQPMTYYILILGSIHMDTVTYPIAMPGRCPCETINVSTFLSYSTSLYGNHLYVAKLKAHVMDILQVLTVLSKVKKRFFFFYTCLSFGQLCRAWQTTWTPQYIYLCLYIYALMWHLLLAWKQHSVLKDTPDIKHAKFSTSQNTLHEKHKLEFCFSVVFCCSFSNAHMTMNSKSAGRCVNHNVVLLLTTSSLKCPTDIV